MEDEGVSIAWLLNRLIVSSKEKERLEEREGQHMNLRAIAYSGVADWICLQRGELKQCKSKMIF